jgi:hypothetical protein
MQNMKKNYSDLLSTAIASNPTFKGICEFNINNYEQGWYEQNKIKMANGTGILDTSEEGITYMASYSDMHTIKLINAFNSLFNEVDLENKSVEIIDWGCGQAFATCVLIDYIKDYNVNIDLSKFILIEPSCMTLQRGFEHINAIYQREPKPQTYLLNEKADSQLRIKNIPTSSNIKIHLFSNLLDLQSLDLEIVFQNVITNFNGINYFVCVSPVNGNKLQTFYKMFQNSILVSSTCSAIITEIFRPSLMRNITKSISRVEYIFKINNN